MHVSDIPGVPGTRPPLRSRNQSPEGRPRSRLRDRLIKRLVVRVMPVPLRVVHAEREAFGPACRAEFADVVAAERRIRDLEVRMRRVPHVEAVVMLGDGDHVFGSGPARHPGPLSRVEGLHPETLREVLVFGVRNRAPARVRESAGGAAPTQVRAAEAGQAVMDEEAVARLPELAHALCRRPCIGVPFGLAELVKQVRRLARPRVAGADRPLSLREGPARHAERHSGKEGPPWDSHCAPRRRASRASRPWNRLPGRPYGRPKGVGSWPGATKSP